MGRLESSLSAILLFFFVLILVAGLVGCGGNSNPPGSPLPASIRLAPSTASIELGSTLQLTPTALGADQRPITISLTYQSSNPQAVTVANNGLICAGSWDSLATPVICTPQGVGTAQVIASASGTTSAPVTVYVHQHIDRVQITPVTPPPGSLPPGPGGCFTAATGSVTRANRQNYQATALSQGMDITSTVGPINWSVVNTQVATVSTTAAGPLANQAQVATKIPGRTQIFASAGNNNSDPQDFTTCPVQSISLSVSTTGGTIINAAKGTSNTINATVVDTASQILGNIPLTWSSRDPAVAAAPANASVSAAVSGSNVGGTSITASCIPPGCNSGLSPMQAIYAVIPITATYTGTTTTAFSAFTAIREANPPLCDPSRSCTPLLVQVSGSPKTASSVASLPAAPNSLRVTPTGDRIYLGSEKGLMQVNPTANPVTVSSFATVTGKVLAISPSGGKVIVADTLPVAPNPPVKQVFILDTSTNSSSSILLDPNAASAVASFSPDNLKAFIAVNAATGLTVQCQNTAAVGCLYVYSAEAALQTIPLDMTATDLAFLPDGAFSYMAGVAPSSPTPQPQITVRNTCDNSISQTPNSTLQVLSTPGVVQFVRTLNNGIQVAGNNGAQVVGLDPPNVDIITFTFAGTANLGNSGCPLPFQAGYLYISNSSLSSFNLGQGAFTPIDFLVSSDGQKAYVVIQNQASVVVFDIPTKTVSSIALVGNPAPLAGSLAPDGLTLYVAASDNSVHVIDTVVGGDVQQVPIPSSSLCSVSTGGPPPACTPDLLVVRP